MRGSAWVESWTPVGLSHYPGQWFRFKPRPDLADTWQAVKTLKLHASRTLPRVDFHHTILGCTCRIRPCCVEVKIATPPVDFPRVYVSRRPNITCFRLLSVTCLSKY